jgi:16S rRNA pseudouridine516 synthase
MKKHRLDQLLSSLGYSSRREVGRFLFDHEVMIHGEPAAKPDSKVEIESVTVDGEPLLAPYGLLALYHKPAGCVCSHTEREGETIYSLLPEQWSMRSPAVSSVGRLDRDTTGVLLITDQGQLIQRYTSPRSNIEKVYRTTVDKPLDEKIISIFAAGDLMLHDEDTPCLPAKLRILDDLTAELTLTEGRYHQVRRMFASQGWYVEALHRTRFGSFDLEGLAPGEWKLLPMEKL